MAVELSLDEIPFDGFIITTRRVADAVERMVDRTLDLDANEYVVSNTAERDWILAESRKQRSAANDQRTEHWVILGFEKTTERLREYIELPASILESEIVGLLGDPPDSRYRCWDAPLALLGVVEEVTGRSFDVSERLYMIEYERDSDMDRDIFLFQQVIQIR